MNITKVQETLRISEQTTAWIFPSHLCACEGCWQDAGQHSLALLWPKQTVSTVWLERTLHIKHVKFSQFSLLCVRIWSAQTFTYFSMAAFCLSNGIGSNLVQSTEICLFVYCKTKELKIYWQFVTWKCTFILQTFPLFANTQLKVNLNN